MDFRLEHAIHDYLTSHDICGDADIISIAGATKGVNDPADSSVENQIALSKQLHDIQDLILINHTDCGGYGGRAAFPSKEEEYKHHQSELMSAKQTLAVRYPNLNIITLIADIDEEGNVSMQPAS